MRDQAELAYTYIRERLLSGIYSSQKRLIEQQLSTEIGVSRGALRQALSRLRAEGLVVKGERGGFFVREFTKDDLQELNELRYVLESAAVTLIVARATEDDYRQLKEIAAHMMLMAEHDYSLGVFEADLRFHQTLVKAAHNSKLYDMYIKANIPLTGVNGWKHETSRGNMDYIRDAKEHAEIVDRLEQGQIDEVISLLRSTYHWME